MTNYEVYKYLRKSFPDKPYTHWQIIFGGDTEGFEMRYQNFIEQMNMEAKINRL